MCPQAVDARGFPDPAAAYRHYAEALNASKFCDAIATFEPQSRPDVALKAFKNLIFMGGTNNPKQVAYQQNVVDFCKKYNLPYSPAGFAALSAKLLKRGNVDAELSAFKQAAAESPEAMYVDLMQRMKQVDSYAMTKLDPVLTDVAIHADRATGTSSQREGRGGALAFVRTNKGWLLTAK